MGGEIEAQVEKEREKEEGRTREMPEAGSQAAASQTNSESTIYRSKKGNKPRGKR